MATQTVQRAALGALALALASTLSGCQQASSDHLGKAKAAIAANKPDAALISLKNAVSADPKSAEARFLLGQQTFASGDAPSAVIDLRRARELKAPEDQVVPLLAEAMLASGQARVLIEQLGAVRLADPKAATSLATSLAQAHAVTGAIPQARKLVGEALAADPNDRRARLVQARITAAGGDVPAALAEVDTLLKQQPRLDDAWAFKGEQLERQPGQQEAAAAAYASALQINPGQVQALTGMLGIHLIRNELSKAKETLEALRKVSPKGFHTAYYEARLNSVSGNRSLARTQFAAMMNAVPDNAVLLLASGVNELALKSPNAAASQLGRAVSLAPTNVAARYYLAVANLQLGRPGQATAALAPLLEAATPPAADVLVIAAQARLLQGDAKGADALFERAAKVDAKNPSVRTALAVARAAKGDTEGAMRELQLIAESTDGNEADLKLISAHLARNQADMALKAIAALMKKEPEMPAAYELRGRVLLAQKDADGARKSFEQALQKDKSYIPAIAQLTELDVQQKKFEAARKRLNDLRVSDPTNAKVLMAMASLAGRTGGSATEVFALVEKANRIDPQDAAVWLTMIEMQFNNGNIPAALTSARAAVAAVPDSVPLLNALALCLSKADDHRQAILTYNNIIRLSPRDPVGYIGLANAQISANELDGASKTLQQLLAGDPLSIEGQRLSAGIAMKRRQPKDALAIARNLQRQYPAESFGYALEGEIELDQANHGAATQAFRKGMEKRAPGALAPRLHTTLLKAGKPAEADELTSSWLKANPKDTGYITYLGETAFAAKDLKLAQQRFEQALAVDANLAGALNNLAWILIEQKKPGALALAERAAAITPDNPAVLDTLAQAYVAEKEPLKAVEVLKRAINRSLDPAPLRLSLAKIYIQADDRGNAAAELEKAIELGKTSPQYREARQLLLTLRQR